MYLPTILAGFFALSAVAMPLSSLEPRDLKCARPGDCNRLLDFTISTPLGNDGQVKVDFTIWDDNKATNATTTCSASWKAGTDGWPQQYTTCDDDEFEWSFSKFNSATEWHMEAAHGYLDSPNFYVRSFFNGTAVDADFKCETDATGTRECSLKPDRVINLRWYASIA